MLFVSLMYAYIVLRYVGFSHCQRFLRNAVTSALVRGDLGCGSKEMHVALHSGLRSSARQHLNKYNSDNKGV